MLSRRSLLVGAAAFAVLSRPDPGFAEGAPVPIIFVMATVIWLRPGKP